MSISFEQPQPFSPAISSAYGQAGVMQQNNPLFLQQQQMRQQQMLAQQEMQQRAAEHTAAVQQQAAELAQRGELARQEMGLRQQALDAEQSVSARDVFHAQAAMAAQAQAADLHAYYSQQEMTQHEAILLQRKRQALAEVMNNPTLDDETRQNMALQIKTGIDPLEAKQKATQLKYQQMQTQRLQQEVAQQTSIQTQNEKFWAMGADDRHKPVYDRDLLGQVDGELTARQRAGEVGDLTPQERDQLVRAETRARGGLVGYESRLAPGKVDFTPAAKLAPGGSGSAAGGGKGVEFNPTAGQLKLAQAEADAAVPPVKDDVTGKTERTDENAKYLFRVLSRMRDEHAQQQKPARQPWAGVLPGKPAAAAGQQQQTAGGQPAEGGEGEKPKLNLPPFNPTDPKHPVQVAMVQQIEGTKQRVAANGNLAPDEKTAATFALDQIKQLVATAGSVPQLKGEARKKYDQLKAFLERLGVGEDAAPATQQPQQPQPQPQPGPPPGRVPSGRLTFTPRPGQSVNPGGF